MPVAVGVDLGSTHCNVGVWHQGRPEVIANHHGLRATPTMVAFTDSEVLVGEAALSQMPKNVANTITGFKWMVGQNHAQMEPHIKAMLGEFGVGNIQRLRLCVVTEEIHQLVLAATETPMAPLPAGDTHALRNHRASHSRQFRLWTD